MRIDASRRRNSERRERESEREGNGGGQVALMEGGREGDRDND